MNLYQKTSEFEVAGVPYAWATVVNAKGSVPRDTGAKMLITQGETFGTIGGGAVEHAVINDARSLLQGGKPVTKNYLLGPELGQCCGGEMAVFIEPVMPPKNAVVFGAGHIAEHLVPMLKHLNFHVTLADERTERIGLPAFNTADTKLNELPSDALKEIPFGSHLYIIVLTHAHIHDEEIVQYCLDKPFRYLGMIGSKTKWEKFKARYKARGFSDEQIGRVKTPIGLKIGGDSPFEIAISIIAEIISQQCHIPEP